MQVQTFRAESLQAALQLVRQTLGPDAAIVHTRQTRHSRLGIFSKTVVEVEATLDNPTSDNPKSNRVPSVRHAAAVPTSQTLSLANAPLPQNQALQHAVAIPPTRAHSSEAQSVTVVQTDQPEALVLATSSLPRVVASSAMLEVQSDLLAAGVPEQFASRLLSEVDLLRNDEQGDDTWAIRGRLGKLIASNLRVSGSVELNSDPAGKSRRRPEVVAMVGPTGAGKTTTLAKVAAGFRFDMGCQVGLIALDTFRLGAVDQLLQYAELISAPLEVVSAPEQVTPALERLSECDLVLLDTAGRAPNDAEQLSELRKFLILAKPQSTQLVVSATSSAPYVAETVRKFSVLEPSNLLITKLDEAIAFGSWLPLLHTCPLPISYLTTGQRVPQDIVVASSRRLTSLILGMNNQG